MVAFQKMHQFVGHDIVDQLRNQPKRRLDDARRAPVASQLAQRWRVTSD